MTEQDPLRGQHHSLHHIALYCKTHPEDLFVKLSTLCYKAPPRSTPYRTGASQGAKG